MRIPAHCRSTPAFRCRGQCTSSRGLQPNCPTSRRPGMTYRRGRTIPGGLLAGADVNALVADQNVLSALQVVEIGEYMNVIGRLRKSVG